PRVLPEGRGAVNPKGMDFYNRLVDELLQHNIRPYVTLYHWDLPSALQKMGGWAARDTVHRFADYVELMARTLGDRVKDWITHNEPWVVAFVGNLHGRHAPGWEDLGLAIQISHHLLLSHSLAMPVLRAHGDKETRVGITLNFSPAYPASEAPQDVAAAQRHDGFHNRWFLDPLFRGHYPEDILQAWGTLAPRVMEGDLAHISAPIDFLGVNYYSRGVVKHQEGAFLDAITIKPEGEYTHMGWEVYPQALTDLLIRLTKDYAPQAMY
ncbi:MAG: family 1 glycosylhydrolase, partial [Chloroflexi bacterium]|nr:family 1 glycosylhydrolase [Chloroflexota bacterium]